MFECSAFSHEDVKTGSHVLHQRQIESGQEDKVLRTRILPSLTSMCPLQVRIFPYLIGRESAFADNLKWMACANKGSGHFDKLLWRHPCVIRLKTVWCGVLCDVKDVCGCVCVLAWAGSDSSERRWSGTWRQGHRSIRSNPSSCQSVFPLAAHCWWLPRVNVLDECTLEGKVAARKTHHGMTMGETSPKKPLPLHPPPHPCCGITLHVQCEALSAAAGAYIKSNDFCVALSWMPGNLHLVQPSNISRCGN